LRPLFGLSGEFFGGNFKRRSGLPKGFLPRLKNVLAFGTANLGSPIGNAAVIQVKFRQALGAGNDHKFIVYEFPFLSFPLTPALSPFAGERGRVRGLNLIENHLMNYVF
jgi:hypothetical protein